LNLELRNSGKKGLLLDFLSSKFVEEKMPYKTVRNIRHDGNDYPSGVDFPEEIARPEQIAALVASGALAPVEESVPKKGKKGSE
jgi:hypothetical protein